MMNMKAFILLLLILLPLAAKANDPYANFPEPQADFQAHINEVREYLLETQMPHRKTSDVEFNLPFEQNANPEIDYRGRFLLIHGLNDSPYVFIDVANALTERGYDVRAILLPGHGNTPKAQLNMTYQRWLKVARAQLQILKAESDAPVYLSGFSMGAVLASILALENKDIAGLLLFSPAYQSKLNHYLRWSGIYSRFKPWVFGGMIIEDNPSKYNSIPINGAAQYYNLTKVLKKKWGRQKLSMPVLAVASTDDSVVDVDYFIKVFNQRFDSNNKRLLIYTNDPERQNSQYIEYRKSEYPDLRVINQSHQGVIIAPDNPLFGMNGSVLVCNGNDWPTFSACLRSSNSHWYGAQHTPSPDGVSVARTTYNADFDGVFEAFDKLFN